jgi:hypothetical protein
MRHAFAWADWRAPALVLACLAFACGEAGAQAPTLQATLFVPATGSPVSAPFVLPLDTPLQADETVTIALKPSDSFNPACPISPTISFTGATAGSKALAVSLGASSLSCGGGRHDLTLLVTRQQKPTAPPAGTNSVPNDPSDPPDPTQERPVRLTVRYEPRIEIVPATDTIELTGVAPWLRPAWTEWNRWLANATSRRLLGWLFVKEQQLEIRNTSIGPVNLEFDVAALTKRSEVREAEGEPRRQCLVGSPQFASPSITPAVTAIDPARIVKAVVALDVECAALAKAGRHRFRLHVTATEAAAEATASGPISRTITVPVQVSLRDSILWPLLAMLIGFGIGKLIRIVTDPVAAEKQRNYERIRTVRAYAIANSVPLELITPLDELARRLEIEAKTPADFETEFKKIYDQIKSFSEKQTENHVRSQDRSQTKFDRNLSIGSTEFYLIIKKATDADKRFKARLQSLKPPPFVGELERNRRLWWVVTAAIWIVGPIVGLKLFYVDDATLGANGILDLAPLLVWGATIAVADTLTALRR